VVSDDEFETEIAYAPLVKRYRQGTNQIEDEVSKAFERDWEELRRLKIAALEREKAHRDLLNLCVFPFTEKGQVATQLGYKFVYGSPLSELDQPSFDFLIARLRPNDKPAILIAGEVKSSVGSPIQVVNEVAQKQQAIEANIGHILRTYLNQAPDRDFILESVIAVDSVDANNIVNAVVGSGHSIRVWHGPSTGPERLSIAAPPEATPQRHRFLHADSELNRLLDKLQSVRRVFDIWPKTHVLIELGALIHAAHPLEKGMVVRRGSLREVLEHDVFYLSQSTRDQLASRIIETGMGIGFLETTMIADEYRVVARGLRRDVLEQSLTDKWIKWQIAQDRSAEIARRKEVLQRDLRAERSHIKTMFDY
jgi:hypothetical protein